MVVLPNRTKTVSSWEQNDCRWDQSFIGGDDDGDGDDGDDDGDHDDGDSENDKKK